MANEMIGTVTDDVVDCFCHGLAHGGSIVTDRGRRIAQAGWIKSKESILCRKSVEDAAECVCGLRPAWDENQRWPLTLAASDSSNSVRKTQVSERRCHSVNVWIERSILNF